MRLLLAVILAALCVAPAHADEVRPASIDFTERAPGEWSLAWKQPVASARQLNLNGESLGDCQLDDGQIQIRLAAHEWVQLEARW